jgi:hypothetical protein
VEHFSRFGKIEDAVVRDLIWRSDLGPGGRGALRVPIYASRQSLACTVARIAAPRLVAVGMQGCTWAAGRRLGGLGVSGQEGGGEV